MNHKTIKPVCILAALQSADVFTVVFTKKNKEVRQLTGRFPTEEEASYPRAVDCSLLVVDVIAEGFRKVNLETVSKVVVGNTVYKVTNA